MSLSQRILTIASLSLLAFTNVLDVFANIECDELPAEDCAFAVSSRGVRCVLEKYSTSNGDSIYECQASTIMSERSEEWIESDECINACGLERMAVGLSTDVLLDSKFAARFCESECQNSCPNIVDLFTKLAAGEGIYLPGLCKFFMATTGGIVYGHSSPHKFARFLEENGAEAPSSS